MIKNELRIGNYISYEDINCAIIDIMGNSNTVTLESLPQPGQLMHDVSLDEIKRISITPFLLKEKMKFSEYHMTTAIRFQRDDVLIYKDFNGNKEFHWVIENHSKVIKFVDEVQNIYQFLEETDLTFKI